MIVRTRQPGFSLIELVVVMGIVGILAATAIPQISFYRKRAYEAEIQSNLMNAVKRRRRTSRKLRHTKPEFLIAARHPVFTRAPM